MADNNNIQVLNPQGERWEIPEEERYLLDQGWRELTPEELEQERSKENLLAFLLALVEHMTDEVLAHAVGCPVCVREPMR